MDTGSQRPSVAGNNEDSDSKSKSLERLKSVKQSWLEVSWWVLTCVPNIQKQHRAAPSSSGTPESLP